MTKSKKAASALPIPRDDTEVREAIRELGDTNREVLRLEAEMNDQIAALQQTYGGRVAPLAARSVALTDGLQMYCDVHRERLTRGGKIKTAEFSTGKVSWRLRPARVTLKKVEDVIAAVRKAGLAERFLRTKVEVNKDAMREDSAVASAIKGVTIGSDGEDFIVEPYETQLKEVG